MNGRHKGDTTALFLDTILPGDDLLGLPPGSGLDLTRPTSRDGIESRVGDLQAVLDEGARSLGGIDFASLAPDDRLKAVERAKRQNFRLVTALIVHCLRHYYTDPRVLSRLPSGAVPPFPEGNQIADDDWSILEPVYERGPIHRPVTP